MSRPVTTPFFNVVGDAVFTARVVVIGARVVVRRIVEVFAMPVDVDVFIEALACIIVSDVCLARAYHDSIVRSHEARQCDHDDDRARRRPRSHRQNHHPSSTPPTRWVDKGRTDGGTILES